MDMRWVSFRPPFCVLAEPTNSLHLHSVDALVDALAGYRGGLVVVSHNDDFLSRLGIDTRIVLGADGLGPDG